MHQTCYHLFSSNTFLYNLMNLWDYGWIKISLCLIWSTCIEVDLLFATSNLIFLEYSVTLYLEIYLLGNGSFRQLISFGLDDGPHVKFLGGCLGGEYYFLEAFPYLYHLCCIFLKILLENKDTIIFCSLLFLMFFGVVEKECLYV